MNRREFLKKAGLMLGGAFLSFCRRPERVNFIIRKRRPNIVFIMADDLGYGELGCYGQKKIKTPNIDRLAEEGVRFTDYYSGSPVCAPSRCSLMTGKHTGHTYVRDNYEMRGPEKFAGQLPLPSWERTIAEMLKEAGYATGGFGKWGLGVAGTQGDPLKQGFDCFFGYYCQRHAHNLYPRYLIDNGRKLYLEGNTRGLTGKHYAPQLIADRAMEFVKQNRNRPFFLYYATVIPHLPLQVPEAFLKQYLGKWEEKPYEGPYYLPNPHPRATYAAMISFLDFQVGRLLELLKKLGLEENTIIFFTSDNGTTYLKDEVDYEFFNSLGPLRGYKGYVYEGGIRVPMIVRWKNNIEEGKSTKHLAAHWDIMPTLADVAGIKPPKGIDGLSFLPILKGNSAAQQEHEYLFWDFPGYGGQVAIRKGKWKAVKMDLRKNPDAPLQLYNLEEDIGESRDLASRYPRLAAELEELMIKARSKPIFPPFRFWKYGKEKCSL